MVFLFYRTIFRVNTKRKSATINTPMQTSIDAANLLQPVGWRSP